MQSGKSTRRDGLYVDGVRRDDGDGNERILVLDARGSGYASACDGGGVRVRACGRDRGCVLQLRVPTKQRRLKSREIVS